ncbi:MAG: NAD(+)/NADH kinase [Ruminococcaceae bacterium]|nr:NAD(+)/NADH kinase [Oscillospiraceae bacterium]
MKKIAVIPCSAKDPEGIWAKKAVDILIQAGAQVLYPFGTLPETKGAVPMIGESIYAECDIVVGFGGDGSLINIALGAAEYGKAILGCNMGNVGYLAEVELQELSDITKILRNEYRVEERMVLAVQGTSGIRYALNDVVVSRGAAARISEIALTVDDHEIGVFRSDGLILATPTGSTAYSMSAGGPVIDPALECIAVTPICPHQFGAKPMVFSPSTVLGVVNRCNDGRKMTISLDGHMTSELSGGETFYVRKASMKCRFVRIKQRVFCNTLKKIKKY